MGYKFSVIAVPLAAKPAALAALGLKEGAEDPHCNSGYCGFATTNGYYIIWKSLLYDAIGPDDVEAVAKVSESYHFVVSDTVSMAMIEVYKKGGELDWMVVQEDVEDGVRFSNSSGNIPPAISDMIAKSEQEGEKYWQAHEGFFYIPALILEQKTGFAFDKYDGLEIRAFIEDNIPEPADKSGPEPVEPAARKKPWWKIF